MASTARHSVRLMNSQDRNVQQRIYGGYLLREAFELAFATASLHASTSSHSLPPGAHMHGLSKSLDAAMMATASICHVLKRLHVVDSSSKEWMKQIVAGEVCEPVSMEDVAFLHPVHIGSILQFTAQVTWWELVIQ